MHIRDKRRSIVQFIITVDLTNVAGRKIRGFTEKQPTPREIFVKSIFRPSVQAQIIPINSTLLTDAHARVRISLHETCCTRCTPEPRVVSCSCDENRIEDIKILKFKYLEI